MPSCIDDERVRKAPDSPRRLGDVRFQDDTTWPRHKPSSSSISRRRPGACASSADDAHNLRAVDWEDYEPRMQDLLRRHYGADAVQLREVSRPSAAARALACLFRWRSRRHRRLADRDQWHRLPARGLVGAAENSSRTHRQLRHARFARSDEPRPCARSASPTAPIRSPLSSPAIGSSAPTRR